MRYKVLFPIAGAAFLLTACHSNNVELSNTESEADTDMMISVDENQKIDYMYSFKVDYEQDKEGQINIDYIVENENSAINAGLMVFVNGIPQLIKDSYGNESFIHSETVSEKTDSSFSYTVEPAAGAGASENCYIRFASMLFPDVLITKDPNYFYGHKHSIIQILPREIDAQEDVNVLVTDIDKTEEKENSYGKIVFNEKNKGEDILKTVLNRNDLDNLSLEIGLDDGSYILSFWGDNKPVKLGSSMYYRINAESGKIGRYDFEIPDGYFDGINNFYCILCPEDDSVGSIFIGRTFIFLDEEVTESRENESSEPDSSSEQPYDNETYGIVPFKVVDNTVYGTSGRGKIYACSVDTGQILGLFDAGDSGITDSGCYFDTTGVVIKYLDYSTYQTYCGVLDDELNEIYRGDERAYFTDYDVTSIIGVGDGYCYGTDLECMGLYSKNIYTGEEKKLFTIDRDDYFIASSAFSEEGDMVFEAVSKDEKGTYSVVFYDGETGTFSYYDNRRILGISNDIKKVLIYEPVGIYDDALTTVYILDTIEGKIKEIEIDNSEEADENHLKLSDDGSYLVTRYTAGSKQELIKYDISSGKREVITVYDDESFFYHGLKDQILLYSLDCTASPERYGL